MVQFGTEKYFFEYENVLMIYIENNEIIDDLIIKMIYKTNRTLCFCCDMNNKYLTLDFNTNLLSKWIDNLIIYGYLSKPLPKNIFKQLVDLKYLSIGGGDNCFSEEDLEDLKKLNIKKFSINGFGLVTCKNALKFYDYCNENKIITEYYM